MDMHFTDQELAFLQVELGYTAEDLANPEEDLLLEIGDRCFDIELEGDLGDGSKMPDRCGIAAGIYQRISEM